MYYNQEGTPIITLIRKGRVGVVFDMEVVSKLEIEAKKDT